MKDRKIVLRHKKKKISLVVGECNFIEMGFGLMIFRNKALLLFNFKTPKKRKIHSFFCKPFFAVYTDDKNNVQKVIKVSSWKSKILPKNKFHKLIEIPITPKYEKLVKFISNQ